MTCPINGARPITEFAYGGEFRPMPDLQVVEDEAWADYVFHRNSVPGIRREWWCHLPSTTWFIAERNTGSDEILRTYLYGEHR
ncbi:sarcosine oxidase subunit delta [Leptolyngbya sp. 'hensonii']|uniref:sarcosine oxidase subunit delta n=1 Tax=Leptolyngbya sp. 'hensonii' TaxID=1922337 RepID=UPI00209A90B9|nr:sarcosine oxidase subunit delta [Leptolyngbya sp. 'hensonii']